MQNTFIVIWNPSSWPWEEHGLAEGIQATQMGRIHKEPWTVGSRTSGINVGDRVFLLRQWRDRGIVASGRFSSGIAISEHWDGSGRLVPRAEVDWDTIVDADDRLPIEVLLAEVPDGKWNTIRGGGVHLDSESAAKLEEMWRAHVHSLRGPGSDWTLSPGQSINRKKLHEIFGGRRQGGVSPSAQSPNVMLFTDPKVGRLHGYNDGWGEDGRFHYTGEGQFGDQQMVQGNSSILQSQEERRTLRVFRGVGGAVTYMGRFRLDEQRPWYLDDAVESGGGDVRQVIVFRLRPDGDVVHDSADALPPSVPEGMKIVPIESMNTEEFAINPSAEPNEGERREQRLVLAYKEFMEAKGSTMVRACCRPQGEAKPIFSDVLDQTRNNLLEAKGSATREAIRMIIGQLADYGRFVTGCSRAALLPEKPRPDLVALLDSQDIGAVWRTEMNVFTDNRGGQFS